MSAPTLATRIRRAITDGDYTDANTALECYRYQYGATRGYFGLMRELDFAQLAQERSTKQLRLF